MKDKKIEKIKIILPPRASSDIDLDLVKLTEYLTKKGFKGVWQGGGLLGGEFGYGVDYENKVFMMKPYCWCGKEDECLWCMMNDPKENENYEKMKKELKERFNSYWAKWGGAPQFFYKPTKTGCRWYKWIGRDTKWDKKPTKEEWKKMFKKCLLSINQPNKVRKERK